MPSRLWILVLGLLAGCATDDARLHGTWRSNREATVTAIFQRDPSLTNLPPDRIEALTGIYGHLTMTYSNGVATSHFRGERESSSYRVIERGPDFVVIESAMKGGPHPRIRFVDGGDSYWIDAGVRFEERFDRVPEGRP
jgi:hypothetical protein